MYTMTTETIFWFLRFRWEITFTIKIYKFDDLLLWPSIPECSLFFHCFVLQSVFRIFFFRIVTLVLYLDVEYTLKGTMSKTCYIMSGLGDCGHTLERVVAGQPLTAPPSCSFTVLCALAMMLQHKSRAARSIGHSLKSPKPWFKKRNIFKNILSII